MSTSRGEQQIECFTPVRAEKRAENCMQTGGELEENWRRTGGELEKNSRRTEGELEKNSRRTGSTGLT